MRTAEEVLYEEFKLVFPHVTKEKFKESITKNGLVEAAMKAMKTYADDKLVFASNIILNETKENGGDLELCRKIRHKIIDIKLD